MIVGLAVVAALLVGLPVAALLVAPRLRPPRPRPRLGTGDRAFHLAREVDGPTRFDGPAAVPPGELGALVLPDAGYQQVTATLLDLARRGHLHLTLRLGGTGAGDTPWWTLTAADGEDELAAHERVLLHVVGVDAGDVRFPNLTRGAVARVVRPLREAARAHTGAAPEARALQRGIAQYPGRVDARWFAHAVALDVSPVLARSLDHRGAALPAWVTSGGGTAVTWTLLDRFALLGSPLLPRSPMW
ncbi:hypothetical protein GCM10027047_30890 [Rhodococcus aerolatus]